MKKEDLEKYRAENGNIIAYKVFNPDWTCRGFKFEVGKEYKEDVKPEICGRGFHACLLASDCFNYYTFNSDNKVAIVELSYDDIQFQEDGDSKVCSSYIKIVKQVDWQEVLTLCNLGKNNTGYSNTGYSNTGNWNTGNWNTGNWNTGDWNTGKNNTGYSNTGYSNTGDNNTGYSNTGDNNAGNWNTGNWNTGFFNSKDSEKIYVFNKLINKEVWENAKKPDWIYNINPTSFILEKDMSKDEKEEHPTYTTLGGYLKKHTYKQAWQNAYEKATKEDIELTKKLPCFDSDVFYEITGIRL